jgi:glycosyltransferase involved in cell wall biosynthesis
VNPSLTVGIPVYRDYDGLSMTVQSLRLEYAWFADAELLFVDNCPDDPDGRETERFAGAVGARYVPLPGPVGTAAAKNAVFAEATGDVVLCLDSHVLLGRGALYELRAFYCRDPRCPDLVSGPILRDDLTVLATHLDGRWGGGMWGTWQVDPRGLTLGWPAFEVPSVAGGLLVCRRDAWPGFNPRFSGFGGEEGYLAAKFHALGRRCLCLPSLRWWHRFRNERPAPYPLSNRDKARNYVLGLTELGLPLDDARQHFVPGLLSAAEWNRLAADPDCPEGETEPSDPGDRCRCAAPGHCPFHGRDVSHVAWRRCQADPAFRAYLSARV